MRPRPPALLIALLAGATLLLAGCESAEERAERHFRSGLALLEAGDAERALVELRNVLKYDVTHREARLTFARVQLARGEVSEALSQYLRLAEQHPEVLEARLVLAEAGIEAGRWEEAERHGRAAAGLEAAPGTEAARVGAIAAALDQRQAVLDRDEAAAASAAAQARAALEALEEAGTEPVPAETARALAIAHRTVVRDLLARGARAEARAQLAAALAVAPQDYEFHVNHLRLTIEEGDGEAVGRALAAMTAAFPDDDVAQAMLVAWHLDRGDAAGAEAVLRARAEAEATPEARIAVVDFLRGVHGAETAAAELDRLIAGAPDPLPYHALRARFAFDDGDRAAGIAALEAALATAPASDESRRIRVDLARMLDAEGRGAEARARIDEVLAEDAGQVEALRLRAAWLIEEDRPGEALLALRAALGQAPRDAAAIALMGRAHEREGARELAGERYALALEISGHAPAAALDYAGFLLADGRTDAAEAVLAEALRAHPRAAELIVMLARIQLDRSNWSRVSRLVADLRGLGTEAAREAGDALEADRLLRQGRVAESAALLQDLAAQEGSALGATVALVLLRINAGEFDAARILLEQRLSETPDEPVLRLLRATLHELSGAPAEAEAGYRALVAAHPGSLHPVRALYRLLAAQDRDAEAGAVLQAALEAAPEAPGLLLLAAARHEAAGEFEAAIALYERLYARDSGNLLIANNLASLLSTRREDAGSLERAFTIARRLREAAVPAFQDTYGWIEHRRGNHAAALGHLERAARGLPGDAQVHLHLGLTLAALDRPAEARAALERALALAGDTPLPRAEAALAALAAPAAADDDG